MSPWVAEGNSMAARLAMSKLRVMVIIALVFFTSCNLPQPETPTDNQTVQATAIPQAPAETYWMVTLGGAGRDYATSLIPIEDGFVVAGMTSTYGLGDGGANLGGSHDFMAVKLDRDGNLVWATTIGGSEDERGSYSVRPTADGGFLLTGTTRSFGAGQTDILVVKLDANGEHVWSRAIGGPGSEGGMTTLELEDGLIVMGDTDSIGAGNKDLLVVRLSGSGEIEWAKSYGGPNDDVASGIARTGDGYIIGGTIWSFGAGQADSGLIKIDAQGNVIWALTIGGDQGEGINWDGVRITGRGGIAFGDKTGSFGAQGGGAIFGIELDRDGNLIWSTMIDGPLEDAGWTMTETEDGFIAGGKLGLPEHGGDIVFVKFSPSGELQWSRIFGEAGLDEIEEIRPMGDGFIMAGVARLVEPNGDFLVAWVNADGFVGGGSDPISAIEFRSVAAITPEIAAFSPAVNPAAAAISIQSLAPTVTHPAVELNVIATGPAP